MPVAEKKANRSPTLTKKTLAQIAGILAVSPVPVNRRYGATLVGTIVRSIGNDGVPDPDPEIKTGVAHPEVEAPQRIIHHTREGGIQAL